MQTKQQKAAGAYTSFCEKAKLKSDYSIILWYYGQIIPQDNGGKYLSESELHLYIERIIIEQNVLYMQWLEFKKTPDEFASLIKIIKDHWFAYCGENSAILFNRLNNLEIAK